MDTNKAVILCVDDEENPLVLRKLALQKAGYDVITARSANEALAILASCTINLVLSDHLMPGLTGAQLAEQIKSQYPGLPVMLLSGVNEIPPEASAADAFISKIEGPDRLCQEIAAALDRASA
jgi:CheY-like chemotaxis protein